MKFMVVYRHTGLHLEPDTLNNKGKITGPCYTFIRMLIKRYVFDGKNSRYPDASHSAE